MRRLRTLADLRGDTRGASVIELALACPILLVLLVGLVDVSGLYSARMTVQQAAARSLERLQVSDYTTNFAFVRTEAAAAAGVPVSQVTIDSWLECNGTRQAATVRFCTGTQVSAKYVQVAITSSYTPYFDFSPVGQRQANGTVAINATSAVRYG